MALPDPVQLLERRWRLAETLAGYRRRVEEPLEHVVEGQLTRLIGLTLEANGCQAPIGAGCRVKCPNGQEIEAEVVGFSGERMLLMPVGSVRGVVPGARVVPSARVNQAQVGPDLLGRVLDGAGRPLDGAPPPSGGTLVPLSGSPINPLQREPIRDPLDVGVRAINALLTVGRGQRMGLFAGSGVGKSMLLGMMTRFTDADVTVVGLIGERGREVLEFVREVLGEAGLQKSVVIAAPADSPPLLRVHGAMLATSVAEYFRAQGKQVLLLMDSITRFAQAQREIGLAVGEPPTTKGYPPSTFARISELLERAGTDSGSGGSITAFYTVLAEGDDHSEVIADTTRAILDGHIVLSRKLADSGQYPAINVESSISRAMHHVVGASQISQSQQFRALCAIYEQQRDLINVGAYQAGTDPVVDRAIEYYPRIQAFLRQPATESVCMEESRAQLAALFPQTGSQEQGAQ